MGQTVVLFVFHVKDVANKATETSLLRYLPLISHVTLILQFTAARCEPSSKEASVEVGGGLTKW